MLHPIPPQPASPRPASALIGLLVVVALVVSPLVATLRAGLSEADPAPRADLAVASFASLDLPSEEGSLRWPTATELEAIVEADRAARWERYVAALPPPPAPTPAPAPAPAAPAPAPAPDVVGDVATAPGVPADSVWDALAVCESSSNWAMNSGNGFYGGIQFMHSTWVNMGGRQWAEYPHQATREQQIEVATRLQAQYGWGQWPACSAKLGLR